MEVLEWIEIDGKEAVVEALSDEQIKKAFIIYIFDNVFLYHYGKYIWFLYLC